MQTDKKVDKLASICFIVMGENTCFVRNKLAHNICDRLESVYT